MSDRPSNKKIAFPSSVEHTLHFSLMIPLIPNGLKRLKNHPTFIPFTLICIQLKVAKSATFNLSTKKHRISAEGVLGGPQHRNIAKKCENIAHRKPQEPSHNSAKAPTWTIHAGKNKLPLRKLTLECGKKTI